MPRPTPGSRRSSRKPFAAPSAYEEEQRIAREIQAEDEADREVAKPALASAPFRVAIEMPAPEYPTTLREYRYI
jgi:hypothetical protein